MKQHTSTLFQKLQVNDRRQAVAWAIDKKAIVDALYAGNGVMATQFLPQSLWGWNPDIKQTCCDMDKSKALLKEAGKYSSLALKAVGGPEPTAAPGNRTYSRII